MATAKKTAKEKELIEDKLADATQAKTPETAGNIKDKATSETGDEPIKKTTKAGKHSAKAVAEAEAENERKAKAAESKDKPETEKPRNRQKPNPLKAHGKGYRKSAELIDKSKQYELAEALELAKKTSHVKFDASVEIHLNLGADPRQADQMVRASVVLPAGTGKSLRVAVIAPADKQAEAKAAGADVVGEKEVLEAIEKGKIDFDILIATPDMMARLGKVAKVLGPKGLMPNPKSGTVTANVAGAVKDAKAGKVEFRLDKQSIIHQAIGKVSFSDADLLKNATTIIDAVMKAKPSAVKGTYMKSIAVTTSMGPGIKLNVSQVLGGLSAKK